MKKIKSFNRKEFILSIIVITIVNFSLIQSNLLSINSYASHLLHTILFALIFYIILGRYKDMKKSYWNIAWILIPIIGPLIVLSQTLFLSSKQNLKRNYLEVK